MAADGSNFLLRLGATQATKQIRAQVDLPLLYHAYLGGNFPDQRLLLDAGTSLIYDGNGTDRRGPHAGRPTFALRVCAMLFSRGATPDPSPGGPDPVPLQALGPAAEAGTLDKRVFCFWGLAGNNADGRWLRDCCPYAPPAEERVDRDVLRDPATYRGGSLFNVLLLPVDGFYDVNAGPIADAAYLEDQASYAAMTPRFYRTGCLLVTGALPPITAATLACEADIDAKIAGGLGALGFARVRAADVGVAGVVARIQAFFA